MNGHFIPAAPPAPPRRPRSLAVWLIPAAVVATLVGCVGGVQEGFREAKIHLRAMHAAEEAFLHRGDLFHNCCSSPLDFKHGFKDGYVEVALNGDDVCASPTPPECYWGCTTGDPCSRTELLNCYYDGWAHGAIAAAQDGVVGMNTVPIRNICGGYNQTSSGFGPRPGALPGSNEFDELAAPAPAPSPYAPALEAPEWDQPLNGEPTPAPIPLLPPADGEGSVGGPTGDDALERLLDADRFQPLPAPAPIPDGTDPAQPAPDAAPDAAPDTEPSMPTLNDPFEVREAGAPLTGAAPQWNPGPTADGPRVTTVWGASE